MVLIVVLFGVGVMVMFVVGGFDLLVGSVVVIV